MAKNNREDGVVFTTKTPKMNVLEEWQVKLRQIANSDRDTFASDEEYNHYIETSTKNYLEEQEARYQQAMKELERYNPHKEV